MQFDLVDIIPIAVVLLISVSFHEAMHAFASHWLGDPTAKDLGRITLNPFKHIDVYLSLVLPLALILLGQPPIFAAKPVPFNPARIKYDEFGAALTGIAGPLTNLLLAVACAGVLHVVPGPSGLTDLLVLFVEVNIALFVFNMIPFPPLDGSRLLYAFAPEPVQKVMYQIEALGFLPFIFILLILSPVLGPFLANANNFFLHLLLPAQLI